MTKEPGLAPTSAIELDDDRSDHLEEWKDETAGVDRVITVALSVKQPRTVDWISDQAEVSPSTARDHLERLVELHVLSAVEQRGAKTYFPDSAYQRFREVSQLVEEHTRDEIERITIGAKEDIEEIKEKYDVESPEELRKLATEEATTSTDAREYFKKASEWDTHLHMLSIAKDALERYDEFSQQPQSRVDSVA